MSHLCRRSKLFASAYTEGEGITQGSLRAIFASYLPQTRCTLPRQLLLLGACSTEDPTFGITSGRKGTSRKNEMNFSARLTNWVGGGAASEEKLFYRKQTRTASCTSELMIRLSLTSFILFHSPRHSAKCILLLIIERIAAQRG